MTINTQQVNLVSIDPHPIIKVDIFNGRIYCLRHQHKHRWIRVLSTPPKGQNRSAVGSPANLLSWGLDLWPTLYLALGPNGCCVVFSAKPLPRTHSHLGTTGRFMSLWKIVLAREIPASWHQRLNDKHSCIPRRERPVVCRAASSPVRFNSFGTILDSAI